ncbi:MAG: HD domain-containing protein [Euryarchaeota archaeon]|nr:HD domain-containing protein [Euryarchaeota archaeon]MDE1835633.1 HD domain-containing protein [Euryarchaeota archaeon]MDE1878981.1 HD domain-containing protein [Euryarchaeota archaeon]MDE2043745.1 HD domain-containing protein [Thermoplasmata archaeon]
MASRSASYLRDPIYGLVPLSPGEVDLLGIPLLTRLKSIRQMGFAWSIFPGANHTRFEHSVGVMHAAGLLVRDLPGFDERRTRMVRLAGLLHDVGHPPFSHTLELAARLYGKEVNAPELSALSSHEAVTERRVATDRDLREVLERHAEFREIDPKELATLAVGRHPDTSMSLIVHGEIDADRIDYITRDNLHCGFPSGLDMHVIPSLFLRREDGEIVLNEERAYFAEQLLLARHHLQVKIHDEPRDRLADLLLARALRAFFLIGEKVRRKEFTRIAEMAGDAELMALLRASVPEETAELEALLAGRPTWNELAEISFPEISPPARYAVSLLLSESHRDLSSRLASTLGEWLGTDVIADVWGATPPGASLRAAAPDSPRPPVPLTSLPLIRGTVAATHRAMGVRLYVRAKGPSPKLLLPRAHERYASRVDAGFDLRRAKNFHDRLSKEEAQGFIVSLELESALLATVLDAHAGRTFTPDAALLMLSALFEAFSAPPLEEVRVYLEGETGFASIARASRLPDRWKELLGSAFPYTVPLEEGPRPTVLSRPDPDLEADLDRLEAFGLVVRLPREERRGRHFASLDRYALAGWGRGLVRQLLLRDERLSKLHAEVTSALSHLVAENEEVFRAFFGLAGRSGAAAKKARRGSRGELPLPVSR